MDHKQFAEINLLIYCKWAVAISIPSFVDVWVECNSRVHLAFYALTGTGGVWMFC